MSRSRRWSFTVNRNGARWHLGESERPPVSSQVRYVCYQREKAPETGRIHVQGYIEFLRAVRMQGVKAILADLSAHVEPSRGSSEANTDYCTREFNPDGSRKRATEAECREALDGGCGDGVGPVPEPPGPGPFTWGSPADAGRGRRSDLIQLRNEIAEGKSVFECARRGDDDVVPVIARYFKFAVWFEENVRREKRVSFRDLTVYFLSGPTSTGKTRWVYQMNDADKVYAWTTRKPMWFDGYQGQPVLLIDEFDAEEVPVTHLLRILDHYPLTLPVKGSTTEAAWLVVIIVSNFTFEQMFCPQRFRPEVVDAIKMRISFFCSKNSAESDVIVEKNVPSRKFKE